MKNRDIIELSGNLFHRIEGKTKELSEIVGKNQGFTMVLFGNSGSVSRIFIQWK